MGTVKSQRRRRKIPKPLDGGESTRDYRIVGPVRHDISLLTDHDIYLFKEGTHFRLYRKLGAHPIVHEGISGTYFAVWAPNADYVSVVGSFNSWDKGAHPLGVRWDSSGIWEGFIPGVGPPDLYKFFISSRGGHFQAEKRDPFAFQTEVPPRTAALVAHGDYSWGDAEWMASRKARNHHQAPISIYEVHLGSWRRNDREGNRFLTYRELAEELTAYVAEMGFTHVEFLPVMEHPFYGSWGYQTTGYFSPTHRYGSPIDFMFLIDRLHQAGIGVILDWVPSHFPSDDHGLALFDGTHLYEHADPRKGFHPDWKSYIFNHGRNEVREFLISNALFWFDKYHIDGLRVDAVASMLYLDYSRNEGEWIPNVHGGRENLEAIEFLRTLNQVVYAEYPDVQTVAEESTAWPGVSRPVFCGGLGFGFKWNMGWMHDTLRYLAEDPIHRKFHHNELTFSFLYAFHENFVLSLSHDEVVHGKRSLLSKMPGDDWQKFANLRLLLSYMFVHPGKKLLFMGGEMAQWEEWNHEVSLPWHLLKYGPHQGVQKLVKDLNALYCREPSLHVFDHEERGFHVIDAGDWQNSVLVFLRKGRDPAEDILAVCHFTPVVREHYRVGVPVAGEWREIFNSDAQVYGGSGVGNLGRKFTEAAPSQGFPDSLSLTLPPLSVILFKHKP